nr:DUF924 family protein [Pantoea sp. At-9b]
MNYEDVLQFWFSHTSEDKWFKNDQAFDDEIRRLFGHCWVSACRGELFTWRENLYGRLAEIIILDQFSRNLNRQSSVAWQQDGMALILSQEALNIEGWEYLTLDEKGFMLMPWMHSESVAIHEKAVGLFAQLKGTSYAQSAQQHRDIILRFGRYPHRNALLGRASSAEERAFLEQKRLSFF